MTELQPGSVTAGPHEPLEEVAQRVLWLATRMVDIANHDRPGDEVKVGGHQASCASVVSIMTALWFAHLDAEDRVSVKPHASPVLHAIHYLLGNLDRSFLARLRDFGGLQAYPSRTKDPDPVDFSTGSVGLGPVAPLFAAAVRRYVDAHFGPRLRSRFVALLGDAELDEGSVWEAVAEEATSGLGTVMWVVDVNRQSLDRVVPGQRIEQWRGMFEAAGWHVVECRRGRRLSDAVAVCPALGDWLESMPNERYQSIFELDAPTARTAFLDGAPSAVEAFAAGLDAAAFLDIVTDLGGHDMAALLAAFRECDEVEDRPSVVLASTLKGWGLPLAGHVRNHSTSLSPDQVACLRDSLGIQGAGELDRIDPATEAGRLVAARARHLRRDDPCAEAVRDPVAIPISSGLRSGRRPLSTQEAFGRALTALGRDESLAPLLVTTAPDVATTTNLGGFINRHGVFAPDVRQSWVQDALLSWRENPAGRHIELGISEMNFFMLLGQLGLADAHSGQRLIPVGTLYDPFVLRGLDALIHGAYSGARFIVAGTPSGVTLAPEGGAHQSTITPSVGVELPGVDFIEPAYAVAVDWLLCDAVDRVADRTRTSHAGIHYFRLSTRPVDQAPFEAARERLTDAVLRRHVLEGAYRLVRSRRPHGPRVQLAASGAVLPNVLAAAAELEDEGVGVDVVDVTSLGRLHRAWRQEVTAGIRQARTPGCPGPLQRSFDRIPLVTVHDGSAHAMAWLGAALGVRTVSLGVDEFGQSGTVAALHSTHDLDAGSIVNAALAALS